MINEPILKKKNILNRILNNQILITCFTSILMIIVIVGSSYALFNKEAVLTNDVIVKSGSLEVVIANTTDRIELDYTTLGVEDSVGLTYNPYSFSIENTGENDILYYEVRIVDKEHEISTLPHKSLNFSIQRDSGGYSSPINLGDNGSYIAGDFNLSVGEKHLYDLKLWINTEFGEYANNKTLNASIEVILYSDLPLKNNIIYDSNGGSFVAKTNINTDKVSSIVPSMEGYDFGGWTTSPDSKVIEYKKGEEIALEKGKILYAVWKERNMMTSLYSFQTQAPSITSIFFIDDTVENIDVKYEQASIKADLTYDNQGRVLGWLETDPENSSSYHLYVGSDGTTYFTTGVYLFSSSTTNYLFKNLSSIFFGNVNTSNVTDMTSMFSKCSNLTSLDLSSFDTSKVERMEQMFYKCSKLTELDLSNFNTSRVTNISYMFAECSNLTKLDVSSFNTEKIDTSLYSGKNGFIYMFSNCSKLVTLDVSNFITSTVTIMTSMFSGCTKLSSIDVSNFDTSKVTDVSNMFSGCSSLKTLDVSNFIMEQGVEVDYMFQGCSSFVTAGTGEEYDLNLGNVFVHNSSFNGMFMDCSNLKKIDISDFNCSYVTTIYNMFKGCSQLTSVGCGENYDLDISNFNTPNVYNMSNMFSGCINLIDVDLSYFDTTKLTDISGMFNGCKNLTSVGPSDQYSLNLVSFNSAVLKNVSSLFSGCSGLTKINLSNFNTTNVTDISSMFYGCNSLTSVGYGVTYDLDLTGLNTDNVTNMSSLFSNCKGLVNGNLNGLNTSKVTNMSSMFSYCSGLKSVGYGEEYDFNLTGLNTSSVTNVGQMFWYCSNLTIIDLVNFDITGLTKTNQMFTACSNLVTIYCNDDWNNGNITYSPNMFALCAKLRGAVSFNSSSVDITMANPTTGYFTIKTV